MVRHETEICGAYISSCPGTSNNQKFNFTRINGMEWCKLLCRPRRLAKPLLNGLRFKTSLFLQDYAETASPAGYRLFADQLVDVYVHWIKFTSDENRPKAFVGIPHILTMPGSIRSYASLSDELPCAVVAASKSIENFLFTTY